MGKAVPPKTRHRSKSAQSPAKPTRPSALRKPAATEPGPSERLQKFLQDRKKEKQEKETRKVKGKFEKAGKEAKTKSGEKKEDKKQKLQKENVKEKEKKKDETKPKEKKGGGKENKKDDELKEEKTMKKDKKERKGRKEAAEKTGDDVKDVEKTGEQNEEKTAKKEKKEADKVNFLPSKKQKIEHIFHTPERRSRPPPSLRSEGSRPSSSMSSRQKAQAQLQTLKDILENSDGDGSELDSWSTFSEPDLEAVNSDEEGEDESKKEDEKEAKTGEEKVGKAKNGEEKVGKAKNGEEKEAKAKNGEEKEGKAKKGDAKEGKMKKGEEKEGKVKKGDEKEDDSKKGEEKETRLAIIKDKEPQNDETDEEEEDEGGENGGDGDVSSESSSEETGETGDEEEGEEEESEGDTEEEEEDDEVKTTSTTPAESSELPDPSQHALVPVTKKTADQCKTLRNSATHKREWDCFVKQLKSHSAAPVQLSEYAATNQNKVELFNMWLDCGRDWSQCALTLERKMEKKNEGSKGWEAVQGKTLRAKYDEDKFAALVKSRKASGLWYADDDFPDDDDDARL